MSGITLAAQLLARRYYNVRVCHHGPMNDYGGVWEANKYPGAACDFQSRLRLAFSFESKCGILHGGMEPGTLTA